MISAHNTAFIACRIYKNNTQKVVGFVVVLYDTVYPLVCLDPYNYHLFKISRALKMRLLTYMDFFF